MYAVFVCHYQVCQTEEDAVKHKGYSNKRVRQMLNDIQKNMRNDDDVDEMMTEKKSDNNPSNRLENLEEDQK